MGLTFALGGANELTLLRVLLTIVCPLKSILPPKYYNNLYL